MFISLFCRAINHVLRTSPWALERLKPHGGALLAIEGVPVALRLVIQRDGYFSTAEIEGPADVTIILPVDIGARFLVDRENVFSAVRISGAADLAESLGFVFRNLKWDVEADAAEIVGDVAAHRLMRTSCELARGLRSGLQRSAENLREFILEESALVASSGELARYVAIVDELRDDISRLEKRIVRL